MIKKFDCVFENRYKGIFMDVKINGNHVDFSAYKDNEFMVSVCLRDKEVDELIELLHKFKNRK